MWQDELQDILPCPSLIHQHLPQKEQSVLRELASLCELIPNFETLE